MRKVFRCAWCFELNEIFVDPTAGEEQTYEEDCQVCCRPNVIHVRIDETREHAEVESEHEG